MKECSLMRKIYDLYSYLSFEEAYAQRTGYRTKNTAAVLARPATSAAASVRLYRSTHLVSGARTTGSQVREKNTAENMLVRMPMQCTTATGTDRATPAAQASDQRGHVESRMVAQARS
jgi:hypothetical protein